MCTSAIGIPQTAITMYRGPLYKNGDKGEGCMSESKNVAVSFRVSGRFRKLLEAAAVRENRSLTNMLETLLFEYCEVHDIKASPEPLGIKKAKKGRTFT